MHQLLKFSLLISLTNWKIRKNSRKIYRLSDDEREWIEVEEIGEERYSCAVASLNGKIYITGGSRSLILYNR